MDFFQGFGKRISTAAKNVSKRTVEAAEISRLNARIVAIKEEKDSLHEQIGKAYYASRGTDEEAGALYAMCERISVLSEEEIALERLLDEVRKILRCPTCGEEQVENSSYCSKCGTKLIKFEGRAMEPEPVKEERPVAANEESSSLGPLPGVFINWPEPIMNESSTAEDDQND